MWAFLDLAAFGPTRLLVVECISVAAVTAAYGFALTASHFWKAPKVTKGSCPFRSAPRLGSACPRSGSPGLRGPARDRPSMARARLTRHPCRVAHYAEPPLGLSMGRWVKIKSCRRANARPDEWWRASVYADSLQELACQRRRPASRPDFRNAPVPLVGAGLPAKTACQPSNLYQMHSPLKSNPKKSHLFGGSPASLDQS